MLALSIIKIKAEKKTGKMKKVEKSYVKKTNIN
jgi:hypothetical protein